MSQSIATWLGMMSERCNIKLLISAGIFKVYDFYNFYWQKIHIPVLGSNHHISNMISFSFIAIFSWDRWVVEDQVLKDSENNRSLMSRLHEQALK